MNLRMGEEVFAQRGDELRFVLGRAGEHAEEVSRQQAQLLLDERYVLFGVRMVQHPLFGLAAAELIVDEREDLVEPPVHVGHLVPQAGRALR